MDASNIALPLCGLLGGIVLGYFARRNFFCTLSALEQHWYGGNSTGLRTWILAIALAIGGTQILVLSGTISVAQSFYLEPNFQWLGALVGGLIFGVGMALVGTCGFGALVRLGGGSLKSLMALLVLGLFAISTARGLVAFGRIEFFDRFSLDLGFAGDQSIGSIISALVGVDLRLPVTVLILAGLLAWVFSDPSFWRARMSIVTATVVALVIVFGWVVTTTVAELSFEPVQVESASFVMPVGEFIMQFALFTGIVPDYGVGMVCGTVVGSALAARGDNNVRWEACDDARELSRHILGAACMGVGGVLALGCTIGQGISAASLLSLSAPIVFLSIAVGAKIGLAWMVEGSIGSALRL